MQIAEGIVNETYMSGWRAARITCPPGLVPAPGQYLLAQAESGANSALPVPVFLASAAPNGFQAAVPWPGNWTPGTKLMLKGPLGRGFSLPPAARKVVLASWSKSAGRVLALLEACRRQKAEMALLSDNTPEGLPLSVEVLPLAALSEVATWADYAALDMPRDEIANLLSDPALGSALPRLTGYAQVFIETPVPCGGLAECGVCAVETRKGIRMACKDGPVFDLAEITKPQK